MTDMLLAAPSVDIAAVEAGGEIKLRILIAVLVSTFAVIPLVLLQAALTGDLDSPLLVPFLLTAFWMAAIFVVIAGLPIHFALKYFNKQKGVFYAIAGFLVAALFVVVGHPFGDDGYPLVAFQALQLGFFGSVAALVFWRIAIRKPLFRG